MDFKFNKDSGDAPQQEAPGEKKNQGALLVLLLLLVAGFTYVYFFTGLIKPQEGQKTPPAPVSSPQVVKMPLPPRAGESAKPAEKTPEKVEAPKAAVTAPTVVAAAKQVPAQAPPVAKEEPKKAETTSPADKRPLPVQVAGKKGDKVAAVKTEEKKPVAAVKKTAVTDKKGLPAKNCVKKPVSDDKGKSGTVAKAKISTEPWSVVVGNYVLEEALSADMGRVRKAGFKPIIKPSARRKTAMNRLFVSSFNDRAAAQSTLEKLKLHTSDAFIIEEGGKFAVYAGSYLQGEAANSEKERLKATGFSITLKHAGIAIPTQKLSVGPFDSKKAADAALGKLKDAGIKATLSQK